MKKRTVILSVLLAVLLSVCAVSALAEGTACEHDWQFNEYVDELGGAPTCTTPGWAEYVCSKCLLAEIRELPATGHQAGPYTRENRVEATTFVDGHYDLLIRCTACNTLLSREEIVIPAAVHDMQLVSNTERVFQPFTVSTAKAEDGTNVLVVAAQPDEGGEYTLRNLHLSNKILAAMREENFGIIRFMNGSASVEAPVAMFSGDVIDRIEAVMPEARTGFIMTADPTAQDENGTAGCYVSVVIVDAANTEIGVTEMLQGIVLTMNDTQIPVTSGPIVYTMPTEMEADVETGVEADVVEE